VEKKVAQSEQIIDNLLVYSHIKPPQIKCAKLTEILKESVDLAANRLCRRRVKVKHNLAESNGIVVQADPHQIKEVFDNILSNASDAVQEKKGLVTIRVQPAARETVRIVFKDNGVGMSPENLKRAFEPFFTTKSKGTGLGLAVCRQIVDLHDGTIGMVSRLGRGTSVTVSLRRAPAGNNGEAPKLPAAPSGAGARRRKRGDTKG
jgi:signal transduction histidine kinase